MPDLREILARMTVRQKVGQILLPRFWHLREDLDNFAVGVNERGELGGVFLCGSSIWDPAKTRRLCDAIQARRKENPYGLPFLIAVEHQGGFRSGLSPGYVQLPGHPALGASRNPAYAESMGYFLCTQAAESGANLNFGLSLNLSIPEGGPDNAFAIDSCPETSAALAAQFVRGANRAGILCCANGMPALDAPNSLSRKKYLRDPTDYLRTVGFFPFRRAIESGLPALALNKDLFTEEGSIEDPAACLVYHLRREFSFHGLIVSENLFDISEASNAALEKRVLAALGAGIDLLFLKEQFWWVPEFAEDAIRKGYLSEHTLDQSVLRVLERRQALSIGEPRPPWETGDMREFARQLARESVKCVKHADPPLGAGSESRIAVVVANPTRLSESESVQRHVVSLKGILGELGLSGSMCEKILPSRPLDLEMRECIEPCDGADILIFCSYNAFETPGQTEFLETVACFGHLRIVGVAMRDGRDLTLLERYCDEVYALNGYSPANFRSVLESLFGPQDVIGEGQGAQHLDGTQTGFFRYAKDDFFHDIDTHGSR